MKKNIGSLSDQEVIEYQRLSILLDQCMKKRGDKERLRYMDAYSVFWKKIKERFNLSTETHMIRISNNNVFITPRI